MTARDRVMIRYLLGDLSEHERIQVENEYLADDDAFERLVSVDDDLIDAYVRGELGAAEQERFERLCLSSPERRQRVEFARALKALGSEAKRPTPAGTEAGSWWRRLSVSLFPERTPVLTWVPAGAAIVLLAAGSWLAIDRAKLQRREQELQRQVADARAHNEQLAGDLQRERVRGLPTTDPAKPPLIATVTLAGGLVRGSGSPASIDLSPQTEFVRFEVDLDDPQHPQHRAVITTVSWRHVCDLPAQSERNGRTATVTLDASALTAGDYILTLSGVKADGTVDTVPAGQYYFRIEESKKGYGRNR